MDKMRMDTALAASTAMLATAEGANTQALRTSMERAGNQPAQEFDGFIDHLREDPDKGKMTALQALHPIKGDAQSASQLMEMLLRGAGGIADLAPAQVAEAREICETLNLSPSRFDL